MARLTRLSILALAAAIGLTLAPVAAAHAVGPGTATLTFTSAGAPVANQFVSITAPDNPFGGGFTDGSGVLALTDLAVGSYSGAINSLTAPPFSFSFPITAAAPDFVGTFDVPAPPSGPGSMTLTLVSDAPLGFFTSVQVTGPSGSRFADVSGSTATLSNLVLGDYTAQALSNPQNQGGSISFTLTAAEPAFTAELFLPAWPTGTGSISGTVVDDAGQPVQGVFVGAFSNGRSLPSVVTDASGTYAFADLPAGAYSVGASAFGYFGRYADVTLADGESAVVDFTLPAQNATITGRLVDGDGNPAADTYIDARSGPDFGGGVSGPDGTFVIQRLGVGEWTLTVGGGASPWLETQVVVPLQSGENATIADIVLSPRTTGIIAGSVFDSSTPFPQSIVGICATLLHPDGSPVPGAVQTTFEDGTYYFADLAPGSYTIRFTDCDAARVPQYASAYLGDSTTLGGATIVTATAGGFVDADPVHLHPEVEIPEPTHDATKPKPHDLTQATRDLIDAPASVKQNESFVIDVGADRAGQWVSVWLYTPTKQLGGWHKVAADGTVTATVPKNHPAGNQQLVVQDSDDDVIGWTTVALKKK